MDEQEDLPKDMLEQVGNVSRALLWLPHAETMLCKVLGTKSTTLSVLGPKLFTSHMLKNHPGGLEQQEKQLSCGISAGGSMAPMCNSCTLGP